MIVVLVVVLERVGFLACEIIMNFVAGVSGKFAGFLYCCLLMARERRGLVDYAERELERLRIKKRLWFRFFFSSS